LHGLHRIGILAKQQETAGACSKHLSILTAVVGLAVAVDGFLIEPYRIEVTHSSVQAPLSRPLTIAHLSHLNTSGLGRRERKLLLLLDAERPDVAEWICFLV